MTASRALGVLAFLGVLCWVALAGSSATTANDLFTHIRVGHDVVLSGHAPTVETYSAVAAGRPFLAHEWLSGVIYYWLFQVTGTGTLISLLGPLSALLCAGFLYASLDRSRRTSPLALPLLIFSLYVVLFRIVVRPHVFSLVCVSALVFAMERWRRSRRLRDLVWLAPVQVLWINLHGEALVGPVLIAVLAAGVALEIRFPQPKDDKSRPMARGDLYQVAGMAACLFLCCLLNPYGGRIYLFSSGMLASNEYIKDAIPEWFPTLRAYHFQQYWFWLYLAQLAAVWGLLLSRWRRRQVSDLLLAGAGTFLSIQAQRFVPYLPLLAFPIIHRSLSELLDQRLGRRLLRRPVLEILLAALLIATTLRYGYAYAAEVHREPGWGFGGDMPYREATFMLQTGMEGVVYVDYNDGAPIIFLLAPQVRPVMDSRIDVYGERLYAEYVRSLTDATAFREYLAKYHVNLVLLPSRFADIRALLLGQEGWELKYETESRYLLARVR